MIFYVRKMLPTGLIRFGVGPRAAAATIPNPSELFSTGPTGEYLRRGQAGLYFAEHRGEKPPEVMSSEWSIRQRSAYSFGAKVLMGAGALILFFGILLLINKRDPIGWIEIVLGGGMLATPIIRTTKLRRELRAQAERDRAEREEQDRRNRETVGAFAAVLHAFQRDHSPDAVERVRRTRQTREIPYDAVAPLAREAVLLIGLDALSHFETLGSSGVAAEVDAAAEAVGLNEEDQRIVKRHLWQKLVWHLLADDRLSEAQEQPLEALRLALRIEPPEVKIEREAMRQFEYLRGLTLTNLPSVDAPIALRFQEVCHHRSRGERWKPQKKGGWVSAGERNLTITSRRVVVSNRKEREIRYDEIREIEIDADERLLIIEAMEPDRSRTLQIPDPIYSAGVIAIASETPRKPRGLV